MTGASALQRAATLLDQAAASSRAALDHKLPVLFNRAATFERRGAHLTTAIDQAGQAAALLRDAGERTAAVADVLQAHVEQLRRSTSGKPFAEARHSLPSPLLAEMLELRADRVRLLHELSGLDDGAARTLVARRLEPALAAMVDRDVDARRQVAIIAGLPDQLRPSQFRSRLSDQVWDVIGAGRSNHWSMTSDDALGEARAALDRFRLARLGADGLERRAGALLERDPDSLARDEVRELALIATLDEHVPVALDVPSLREPRRLNELLLRQPSLVNDIPTRISDDSFLREIEAARLVRDGMVPDRAAAAEELLELLGRTDVPTPADARRISLLLRLPESHRPPLPTTPEAWQLRNVGLRFGRIGGDSEAGAIRAARLHFRDAVDPMAGLAELRRSILDDTPFDPHRLPALLADSDAVRAAGIEQHMLSKLYLRELSAAGDRGRQARPLATLLDRARTSLANRTPGERYEAIRDEAVELADRNLARMRGERHDTFGRHPDYAEIGRVVAAVKLLDAVGGAAPARAATEALTW